MKLIYSPTPIVRPPALTPWTWEAIERLNIIATPGETEQTINHAVYTVQGSSTTAREWEMLLDVEPPVLEGEIEIENLTPQIASFSYPFVTWLSDGVAKLRVTIKGTSRIVSAPVELIVVPGTTVWNRWASGTYEAWLESTMRAALTGKDATHLPTLVNNVRNPSNWLIAAGYDVSGISTNAITSNLIAPDTMLQADHYSSGGAWFRSMANADYYRNVLDYRRIAGTDIRVCKIAALPADIVPLCLPPSNLSAYLPHQDVGALAIRFDQEKKALLGRAIISPAASSSNYFTHPGNDLSAFWETLIQGDSGGAGTLLHPDGQRLIGLVGWYGGGGGSGPAWDDYLSAIEAQRTIMGCVGSVTVADLSAFST